MKRITGMRLIAFLTLAASIVVAAALAGASTASSQAHYLPVRQGPALSSIKVSATSDGCYSIFEGDFGIPCYGPYELGRAYDYPSNLNGAGQTIVIVDAYGSPTITGDLAIFDSIFGVPAPPSFTIVHGPAAVATGSGDTFDWGIETSLDVEYAHAMAPGANIVLAVAPTDDDTDLNNTEAAILPEYPGAVVSHSFGDWETDPGAAPAAAAAHVIYAKATDTGDTLVASTGDAGATWTQYTGTTSPVLAAYPASDPLVTAVGGTMGNPYPDGLYQFPAGHFDQGTYGGEQVWNESPFGYDAAGGGAPSLLYHTPTWQKRVQRYSGRTIPDVSYNASIIGGVGVVFSPNLYLVGGTSAGSPQWSAIFALANQARAQIHEGPLGAANADLYAIAQSPSFAGAFHDITVGSNALDSSLGFSATPGYDVASGLGTPDVSKLIPALVTEPGGTRADGSSSPGTVASVPAHGLKVHAVHTAVPG